MTVKDEDKEEAVEIGRRFANIGYKIFATAGTAETLKNAGERQLLSIRSNRNLRT